MISNTHFVSQFSFFFVDEGEDLYLFGQANSLAPAVVVFG
jgi:hypothetical protein